MAHVFVSYVHENSKDIQKLYTDLKRHGVDVWLDRNEILPGVRWKTAIRDAIRNGDSFIACFSKEYHSKLKSFMNEELAIAIDELRQYSSNHTWFIPVLLSECDIPARSIGGGETLLDLQWVPLYEDWETGINRIVEVLKPLPVEIKDYINGLHSKSNAIRLGAIDSLSKAKTDDIRVISSLAMMLDDKEESVRIGAISALGEIGQKSLEYLTNTKTGIRELFEKIKKGKERERKSIYHTMSVWKSLILIEPLLNCIDTFELSDDDDIIDVITSTGEESVDYLLKGLKSKSARLRVVSCKSLEKVPSKNKTKRQQIEKQLLSLAYGSTIKVRRAAIHAISESCDEEAANKLIPLISDPDVQIEIIRCLGKMKCKDAIPTMILLLNDDKKERIHSEIIESLGEIGSDDATDILKSYLEKETHWFKSLEALGKIGSTKAIEILANQRNDSILGDDDSPLAHAVRVFGPDIVE